MASNELEMEQEKTSNRSSSVSLPSKLKTKFESIDNKYSTELTTWKEKQDSLTLTETEASQLANDELSEYYNTQTDKIETKYTNEQEDLTQSITSTQDKYDTQLDKAEDGYKEDKQDLKFDAIDKGWRVSSIYENELTEIESEYNATKSNLTSEKSAKLESLLFEQSLLEAEKESALEAFDIAYAQKISDKIAKIQAEFEKLNSSELSTVEDSINEIMRDVGREKTAEVLTYLKSYTKEDALKFIDENSELESELGTEWWTALVSWINKK